MKKCLVILSLALLFGCAPRPKNNIIIIGVDTLRKDYVGTYNPQRADLTPNIDALLKDSVVFRNAFSVVPITLPSFVSAFTGLYPIHHGIHFNDGYFLDRGLDFLPDRFQKSGFSTAGVIGGQPLTTGRGFERGFESYQSDFLYRPATHNPLFTGVVEMQRYDFITNRPAMDITAIGRDLIQANKGKPLLLFLHYWDPHGPYTPPKEFMDRYKDTPYAGEVAYTDAAIGELLKDLKKNSLYEDSMIVFFSDHGEGLGDHGEAQHSFYLYDSTMAVPLAFKLPHSMDKDIRNRNVTPPVSIMDIFPTLCDLYRMPPVRNADGISLAPLMRGKKGASGHAGLLLESDMPRTTFGWEPMRGLIRWPLKAIICSEPQVFDIEKDPSETRNLHPRDYAELSKSASVILATASTSRGPGQINPEEARKLLSLGYFLPGSASKAATTLPPSQWPQFIEVNRLGDIARWADDYGKAVEEYTKFLKDYPDNARVYMERAWAYQGMDDLPAALADLEKALTLNPENFEVYGFLFQAYRRMGDQKKYTTLAEIVKKKFAEYLFLIPVVDGLIWDNKLDDALALLKRGMNENPNDSAAYLKYLNVLMFQKRQKDAEDFTASVIASKTGQKTLALYFKGMQALLKGDQAKAQSFFNDACYYGADFYQPYFYSGLIYKSAKDLPNATKYFNAARILGAEDPQAHYEWADILATQGQFPQALGGFLTALRYEPENPIVHIAVMKAAWALQKKDLAEREFQWLAKNAPDVLTSVRAQDPILQQMLK